MTSPRTPVAGMDKRQKIIAIVLVLVLIFIIWQVISLFSGPKGSISTANTQAGKTGASALNTPAPTQVAQKAIPVSAENLSPREKQLLKMQEDTQAKYLMALNELQLLKISKDIAETTQAISSAKLNTVENQKKILDAVTPPAPPSTPAAYAKNLIDQTSGSSSSTSTESSSNTNTNSIYTVISVSQIKGRWRAVIGAQGNLYNVQVGDILPLDSSKVTSIDKSGVMLQKNGDKRKISLVPLI